MAGFPRPPRLSAKVSAAGRFQAAPSSDQCSANLKPVLRVGWGEDDTRFAQVTGTVESKIADAWASSPA